MNEQIPDPRSLSSEEIQAWKDKFSRWADEQLEESRNSPKLVDVGPIGEDIPIERIIEALNARRKEPFEESDEEIDEGKLYCSDA
jgi:hypothetical protein